jgi:hypothetical protein
VSKLRPPFYDNGTVDQFLARNPCSYEETTVILAGLPPEIAIVPPHITVPTGSDSASFNIRANDVSASTRVRIWAVAQGVSKGTFLAVKPRTH